MYAQDREGDGVVGMVAADGLLENAERLPLIMFGQRVIALPDGRIGETVQRRGHLQIVIAYCVAIDGERLAEKLCGMIGIALGVQRKVAELHQDVGGLDRSSPDAVFRQGHCLLQIGFRGNQVARIAQRARQIRQRHGNMPLVERALQTAYGDRLFQQGNRPLAQALAPIGEADALEKLSAHLRLQAQIAADFFRAPIQQILGGRFLALRIEGIGLREYVHQERRHLLRPVALLRGGLARQFNAMILPER